MVALQYWSVIRLDVKLVEAVVMLLAVTLACLRRCGIALTTAKSEMRMILTLVVKLG